MDSDSIKIKVVDVSDLDSWNETANVSGPKVINFEVSVKALAADNGETAWWFKSKEVFSRKGTKLSRSKGFSSKFRMWES